MGISDVDERPQQEWAIRWLKHVGTPVVQTLVEHRSSKKDLGTVLKRCLDSA